MPNHYVHKICAECFLQNYIEQEETRLYARAIPSGRFSAVSAPDTDNQAVYLACTDYGRTGFCTCLSLSACSLAAAHLYDIRKSFNGSPVLTSS